MITGAAFNAKEVKRLELLETQWVHRYGINTLQETEKLDKTSVITEVLPQVKSSCEIGIEKVETKPLEISNDMKKNEIT